MCPVHLLRPILGMLGFLSSIMIAFLRKPPLSPEKTSVIDASIQRESFWVNILARCEKVLGDASARCDRPWHDLVSPLATS